jgi:magnesium-transporting ATPase (P-type)
MKNRENIQLFWSAPPSELFEELDTSSGGLTTAEAQRRLRLYGPNRLRSSKRTDSLTLLVAQFRSPLILMVEP